MLPMLMLVMSLITHDITKASKDFNTTSEIPQNGSFRNDDKLAYLGGNRFFKPLPSPVMPHKMMVFNPQKKVYFTYRCTTSLYS